MTTGDLKDRMRHTLQTFFLIGDNDAKKIVKEMLLTVDENGTSINNELRDIINIEEWKHIKIREIKI
jgi:hypothetical protein